MLTVLEKLASKLVERKCSLVTVESCTGGGIAQAATQLSGSSQWFDRGWITYSNEAKIELVGVSSTTLDVHGAVSEAVAIEMAKGGIVKSRNCNLALSVTGIAGPSGGSEEKPVGLVYIGASLSGVTIARKHLFSGNREEIRDQSIKSAFDLALEILDM